MWTGCSEKHDSSSTGAGAFSTIGLMVIQVRRHSCCVRCVDNERRQFVSDQLWFYLPLSEFFGAGMRR